MTRPRTVKPGVYREEGDQEGGELEEDEDEKRNGIVFDGPSFGQKQDLKRDEQQNKTEEKERPGHSPESKESAPLPFGELVGNEEFPKKFRHGKRPFTRWNQPR